MWLLILECYLVKLKLIELNGILSIIFFESTIFFINGIDSYILQNRIYIKLLFYYYSFILEITLHIC